MNVTQGTIVGLAGLRKDVARLVHMNVTQLLVDALADPPGHAYAVAAGRTFFREVFTKELGMFFGKDRSAADHLSDVCWQFLETQWRLRHPQQTPAAFLDAHAPVSPPTEAEIEDAWQLEIASDEASMRKHYFGSARVRKGKDLGGKRFD